ncbi:helical backbone metal receptor [Chondromyces apiculatus]|uniref:Vitamin B12 ABC transporter, B12-binding component BtuF n=1 Tax=Chondromyces apiculatus DSM 436 TaxID=1192034 RepID=A0A017SVN2_9BACT|nr:helical backbone metal receptor [Chondromyces apiculatus]EYF01014.1 Vitamin B12 ABC transporter, B12-binding component BtuF [Chondromyces apiculatus DSM 436]
MHVISIHDDLDRKHVWPEPPARIVSLVPSDTYSLLRLGAGDRLVGRTRYCFEPQGEVDRIEIVGGTKDADVDRIIALEPDVVIANQEENNRHDIARIESAGVRVFVSFPRRVAEGVSHLARLARLLGADANTHSPERTLIAEIYRIHREAEASRSQEPPLRAFVPIWMDPLMTANGETFLSDALDLAGAQNVFADRPRRYPLAADIGLAKALSPERVGDRDTRYPRVTLDEIVARAPEIVLLPDEPHPFTAADAEVFRALAIPAAKHGQIVFCNGKDLMWYGARAVEGIARLRALVDAARRAQRSNGANGANGAGGANGAE